MDARTDAAVQWLLASEEPAIRHLARRDLLGDSSSLSSAEILAGPKVSGLLARDPAIEHPYAKWTGAHWRLVSMAELDVPPDAPGVRAAAERVLEWVAAPAWRSQVRVVDGLVRRHASQEGNALAACARLGLADDERVRGLAESLIEWQWPDGGWNCDVKASGRRSSFHESLAPAWGLHEYAEATGDGDARVAARRAAELFLEHRLFRRRSGPASGEPIHPSFVVLHYPPYWHYDVLHALLVLSRMGLAADPRASDALDLLERRRLKDGRFRPGAYWWRPRADGREPNGGVDPGDTPNTEVVDWGRSAPNEMISLNALRALRAAGRL